MKDVAKRFSVRYYLHLKLVDEDERTYYKQQEIQLWRKPESSMGLNMYSSRSHIIGNCNDLREQNQKDNMSRSQQLSQGDNRLNNNNTNTSAATEEDDYNGEEAEL